ncbi:MAG TPA: hypothetical protein VGQ49_25195 [Bryobacteraceae bacterium]|jgi:hypothetical protein|nr:hypothetical protein [Bryobacteraceae bacterium]
MNGVTRHQLAGLGSLSFVSSRQITLGTLTLLLFYLKYLTGASILLAAITYLCKTKDEQLISN